jgi:hypothetical protein
MRAGDRHAGRGSEGEDAPEQPPERGANQYTHSEVERAFESSYYANHHEDAEYRAAAEHCANAEHRANADQTAQC